MQPMISVIGLVFVDLKGKSFGTVKKDAKNVGIVEISHGGVARNAAENLGKMGLNCRFVSTVSDDPTGRAVIQRLQQFGIDTEYMCPCPNGMGMWLAILDHSGDLVASISHQPDLQQIEAFVMEKIEGIVQKSEAVALDMDITLPLAKKVLAVCRQYRKPLYGVVGNLDVVGRNPEVLEGMDCFVCNQEEAESLLREKITSIEAAEKAVRRLTGFGCKSAVVTLGSEGSVYYDLRTKEHGHYATQEVEVVDSTGAGDAFFSGIVYELAQGRSLGQAVTTGTRIAVEVIQSKENALPQSIRLEVETA